MDDDKENSNHINENIRFEECLQQDHTTMSTEYNNGDTVLVRYYKRNAWKYYVGFIEFEENNDYHVKFLNTVKKPTLKFTTPRKDDRDVLPTLSIVKKKSN